MVRGDPDALERAIGNLVDNAIKWSPPDGRIRICAAGGTVEVSDDGPGIPAVDLPYIFDRFYRSAKARALPGSGLGLAIVRRIADMHGGTAEAIPLVQQILAVRERLLGADHPSTLASRNNLASAYRAAGRPAEAIPLFEQNVAACERLLGADHPRTLASRHHLDLARQESAQAGNAGRSPQQD